MTWVKKGTEFTAECARAGLSDAAYRTHDEAIAWLYLAEATDCRIPKRLMRMIATSLDWEMAVKELLDVHRFWRDRGDCWEVVHHGEVIRQSLAAQTSKRKQDKMRQRRHRQKKAKNVTHDVTRDVTHDVAATQTDSQPLRERGAGGGEKPASLRTASTHPPGTES